ncbi:hypothetical protein SAY87_007958 [Trapa incisa]|uniref:Uncharacterized protein n=1 Tax=Trapa incisa TaxID=236973 RepID=A0AAN7KFW5_9MYRT|nr:hypothetical protein SAY87_007958 [Trapa incisa]
MNEVKANEPFLPNFEAMTGADHLHDDPENEYPTVDSVVSFNKENTKCSDEVKCGMRADGGGMALHITQVEDDLNLGALDGFLDEIDEVEDLDCVNGLSGSCEDYFQDIDLAQEVSALNHCPNDGFRFVNSSSDSHSPGYSGSSNCAVGICETSTIIAAQEIKCLEESCKRLGRCASSFELGKIHELENGVDCLVPEPSRENNKNSVNIRERRQRKPPQRYIEELSKKADGVAEKPPLSKKHTKKHAQLLETESEDYPPASESEGELVKKKKKKKSMKNIDRRKHQIMWTLQEVIKLIDGISEFGVGHWTDIKRLYFASSAYRTPIDLRDKWRNLLRASHHARQSEKKEAAEQSEKSASRPLPKSLLWRIRELAALHPYPRKTKTRSSFFSRTSGAEKPKTH